MGSSKGFEIQSFVLMPLELDLVQFHGRSKQITSLGRPLTYSDF